MIKPNSSFILKTFQETGNNGKVFDSDEGHWCSSTFQLTGDQPTTKSVGLSVVVVTFQLTGNQPTTKSVGLSVVVVFIVYA